MIDRRRLTMGGAGLALSGCADRASGPAIQVNLALPAPPAGESADAQLTTGADFSRRVTAPVRINGQGPFDFVVDTGANRTVIATELAQMLGLPDAGMATVHGVAGAGTASTVRIARLEADTIAMRDVRAPALARDQLGADGLLGVDMLQNRRVLMDFVERRLTITGDRSANADLSSFDLRMSQTGTHRDLGLPIIVPARYRFGQLIIIGADVSGHPVTAFVDSGSQSTVGNNALRRMVSEVAPAAPKAVRLRVPVLSATGQTAEGELGDMPLLRIGGLNFTGLTTVFSDLHVFEIWGLMQRPSLLLGMDILGRFNAIELNYARRQVVFYLPPKGRLG